MTAYLVLSFLASFAVLCHGEKKLQLVQELFRHGDRAPEGSFPTDIHADFWTMGPGQLTNKGKLQHYELGELVAQLYDGFLPQGYDFRKVVARSTDYDRTLMSAYSQLAGLYPPSKDEKFTPNLNWQPIPVHTVPLEDDRLMFPTCPLADQLFGEYMGSDEAREFLEPNMPLYEQAAIAAGLPHSDSQEIILSAMTLRDVLVCQMSHDLSMPDWLTAEMWEALDGLTTWFFTVYFATGDAGKLRGGPLAQEMRENMQAKVNRTLEPAERKWFIYSGHDATVTALLGALKIFNNILPPYASAVFVELYQDDVSNEYYVQIQYKNDTSVPAYTLPLTGCDAMCPFEDFLRLTEDVISDDWEKECEPKGDGPHPKDVRRSLGRPMRASLGDLGRPQFFI